jgi:hypothetical protein
VGAFDLLAGILLLEFEMARAVCANAFDEHKRPVGRITYIGPTSNLMSNKNQLERKYGSALAERVYFGNIITLEAVGLSIPGNNTGKFEKKPN